ncbi:MAG: EcsC family protein [Pseudonocardiales bacterium]
MTEDVQRITGDVGGRVLRHGRQGVGSFHSPERILGSLRAAHPRDTADETVQRLINLHCSQSAVQGAISGVGGIFTLVLTLPLSLFADGVIQARLAYAIALAYGHDPDSPATEAMVASCLVGVGGTSASALGVGAPRALVSAVRRKAVRRVGAKLLTRVGGEGAARLVPFVGAAAAGAMDFALTRSVARRAIEAFKP